MKRKNMFLLFALVLTTSMFNHNTLIATTEIIASEQDNLDEMLGTQTPLQFSLHSIKDFYFNQEIDRMHNHNDHVAGSRTSIFNKSFVKYIKTVYNRRDYANILSQDGSHVIAFLELGNEINLDAITTYVSMRLFYNKLKSCELVDDTVTIQLLTTIPPLLERFFYDPKRTAPLENLDFIKTHLEDLLLTRFTEQLDEFYKTPDLFLEELSQNIMEQITREINLMKQDHKKRADEEESKERLRQVTIKFFELITGKTIWNIKDPEGVWSSFIAIAEGFQSLATHKIINHMDDLDDLFWSLVYRFSYFVGDLAGGDLPLSFYDEATHDLENQLIYFLETPEQDEGIKTKKEIIVDALIAGKAKALAVQSEFIPHHVSADQDE